MEDTELTTLLLDEMNGDQQDFLEFQHFLENGNPCYEMPSSQIILPMSPPDSCPVTPTSPEEENYDVNIPECRTDAPELEHYLKQTNPLQGMQPKRKCGWALEKNEKVKAKKTKKEEKKKNQIKNEKIETSDVPCCRKVLKWNDYKREDCYKLYNSSLIEMESPSLLVTCDKGFTFSSTEDVFICQKKNHFQVTLVLKTPDAESYIKTEDVYQSITGYKVHLYAIKAESPHKKIAMEQSLADRSKRPYHPIKFSENSALTKTLTIGRLHFSETTSNNMRKKGKLNPDQRYFLLVVDVRAYTKQGNYSVGCQASEKLIVRASNPGQFENDVALWSKDKCGDSVYRMGHVGINTDKPEECLSVNGNLQLTGEIMQPSDVRLTDSIEMIDSRQHLENVCKMKLYKYRYSEEYVEHAGLNPDQQKGVGVLGHELKTLLPDAITEGSDIVLPDQRIIKDVLLVNKDRLLMESLGAVQELYKISKMLTSRLVELEAKNDILEICMKNILPDPGILQ